MSRTYTPEGQLTDGDRQQLLVDAETLATVLGTDWELLNTGDPLTKMIAQRANRETLRHTTPQGVVDALIAASRWADANLPGTSALAREAKSAQEFICTELRRYWGIDLQDRGLDPNHVRYEQRNQDVTHLEWPLKSTSPGMTSWWEESSTEDKIVAWESVLEGRSDIWTEELLRAQFALRYDIDYPTLDEVEHYESIIEWENTLNRGRTYWFMGGAADRVKDWADSKGLEPNPDHPNHYREDHYEGQHEITVFIDTGTPDNELRQELIAFVNANLTPRERLGVIDPMTGAASVVAVDSTHPPQAVLSSSVTELQLVQAYQSVCGAPIVGRAASVHTQPGVAPTMQLSQVRRSTS
ncbi:MAG: hypothetical protein LBG99_05260 [Propionibacteriaceae bacterium]|nr:hypothetical protein [Propionibacteriaceae bacterium]